MGKGDTHDAIECYSEGRWPSFRARAMIAPAYAFDRTKTVVAFQS